MNYPFIIISALLVVALLVWVVYRNFKDEKKLEKNMDDPANDREHYHRGDRT